MCISQCSKTGVHFVIRSVCFDGSVSLSFCHSVILSFGLALGDSGILSINLSFDCSVISSFSLLFGGSVILSIGLFFGGSVISSFGLTFSGSVNLSIDHSLVRSVFKWRDRIVSYQLNYIHVARHPFVMLIIL